MNYYNYLFALEAKFQLISSFVEVDERNYQTFSTEISLIFLASCSEFEVVAKELCEIFEPGFKNGHPKANISDIADVILRHCPTIIDHVVDIQFFDKHYLPLQGWRRDNSPNWWSDYNSLKHNRSENYHLAHLENLLKALSALSIVNHYYIWKKFCPNNQIHSASLHLSRLPTYFRIRDVQYDGLRYNDDFDI
ncbi:hypothetical protein PGH12_01575 [Chryseobacterium wangxinyae]|uniref:hypothetical protein n=1 Tax=Chryseobacterium sp. CY350 TaxID=2997336 RepID=UPI002270F6B5|nr:hypothetical protein [Chryseobacterium sp. CY350]MCY0977129.1 hypothetical protein [Chryseobacterium sp. CY350]WBZ95850.1 hypothetical protein PGH12_01575 [Chryseobacterium sp. CY350]